MRVVVLGASGSVGGAVVQRLVDLGPSTAMVTLVRRPDLQQADRARRGGVQLAEVVLPQMTVASLHEAVVAVGRQQTSPMVGISALGIGAGTGRLSIDAHRAVDVQLNAAFARGLQASGHAQHLVLLSAATARAAASPSGWGAAGMARYARVKGEAELAVAGSGLPTISILRPALIVGSRHTPRWLAGMAGALDLLLPARYQSITVAQLAAAMVVLAMGPPGASAVYHRPQMMALLEGGPTATTRQR